MGRGLGMSMVRVKGRVTVSGIGIGRISVRGR